MGLFGGSEGCLYKVVRQGLHNVPISGVLAPEIPIDDFRMESVVCQESLGGQLNHYERKAA